MKIFISHAEEDLKVAKKIYNDLKSAGLKPWLDNKDILPGQNQKTAINQAIKNSSYFLALLSSNTVSKKGNVQKEQKIALEILNEYPKEHIFIIPIRLDNCEIPDEKLQNLQKVDLFPSYESGLNKILHVLGKKDSAPSEQKLTNTKKQAHEEKGIIKSPDNTKAHFDPEQKKTTKINRFHSKMCNRDRQVNDFWNFFQKKSPKHPQFYFIHGDELEGHESLIIRLKEIHLKKHAEKKWGKENADVLLQEVTWPHKGNLEIRKRDLKMNLVHSFTESSDDYSVAALCEQVKNSLVMIKHNIDVSEWDNKQEILLITWYIKEYWKMTQSGDGTPQFLIFFNIQYQRPGQTLWAKLFKRNRYVKKLVRGQLNVILKSVRDSCQCEMIAELKPVKKKDVKDWFRSYKVYTNELKRNKKIDSIFRENNKPVKFKCMAEIEIELEKILIKYEEDKLGWQE